MANATLYSAESGAPPALSLSSGQRTAEQPRPPSWHCNLRGAHAMVGVYVFLRPITRAAKSIP
jgi:hypothetical protein